MGICIKSQVLIYHCRWWDYLRPDELGSGGEAGCGILTQGPGKKPHVAGLSNVAVPVAPAEKGPQALTCLLLSYFASVLSSIC